MFAELNGTLHRRPPLHGGKPAYDLYLAQLADVQRVLSRGAAGLDERIRACLPYVPPRGGGGDMAARGGAPPAAALPLVNATSEAKRDGDDEESGATRAPPIAGWPAQPLLRSSSGSR